MGDKPETIALCEPVTLAGAPPFPTPGIYFGIGDEAYHAIEACSASGLKKLAISTMDYWADSKLNPDREPSDSPFLALGKAYHKRIVEGAEAYAACYAIELDKADYPDALVTMDQIKDAIIEAGEAPISSVATGQMKPSPIKADPDRMKPVTRAAKKEDFAAQLIGIDPDVEIWDFMVESHALQNEGRTMISAKQHARIEIAARMIESDPDLSKAFSGGYPEVAIFWHCPKTGAPMKAKLDYLKLKAIVDLKSFGNAVGRPISRAIDFAISNQRHFIGVVIYRQAVEAAKRMIADQGASVVHSCDDPSPEDHEARQDFALRLAKQSEPPTCLWVYQQTGNAPVTRGRIMPVGTVYTITDGALEMLKRRYVECTRTFGADPWLDIAPIEQTIDEEIPQSATDF
ncbi:MAG: hypothetical protein ACRCYS_11520 [Beijerinckiaceae bacterium]